MATRADAETALGAGRLRRVRKLIRPDLYGAPRARTRRRGRWTPAVHQVEPGRALVDLVERRPVRSPTRSLTRSMPDWRQRGPTGSASTDRRMPRRLTPRRPMPRPAGRCTRRSSTPTTTVPRAGTSTLRTGSHRRRWAGGWGPGRFRGRGSCGCRWTAPRRVRAAGLRQDPGPADPGAAVGPGRGAGHPDQGRGPAADRRRTARHGDRPVVGAGPVRAGAGAAGAGVGPGRRVCGLDGRRTARQGVHRRHRPGRGRPGPGDARPGSTPPRARRCCRPTSTPPP